MKKTDINSIYKKISNPQIITIMGILNITPDSFSDGNKYNNLDKALSHCESMIKNGAEIIDVGGESTRPYSKQVEVQEELDRVIPVIEKIISNFDVTVSIDTTKSEVALESVKKGVQIINDISGFTFDNNMINVAKDYDAISIIMHIKGTPQNMQELPIYDDIIAEVITDLRNKALLLTNNGLKRIVIDPGFGFGKSVDDNYQILLNLSLFKELGYPILAGISRKSMIGSVTGTNPENRLGGSIALNTVAALNGASIIRVHDIQEHQQLKLVIERYKQIFKPDNGLLP